MPQWCKLYVPTADADPLIVELKFWRLATGMVQWELRRFFVHSEHARQSVKIGKLMKRELKPLTDLLGNMFQEDQVFLPELQVLKSHDGQVTSNTRDQWAGTTWAFLAIMAYEGSSARHSRKRQLAQVILETFLRKFISEDMVMALCQSDTPEEMLQLCQDRAHEKCKHMSGVTATLAASAGEGPYVQLRHKLNTLVVAATSCASVAGWFGSLLQDCGAAVDTYVSENDFEGDPLKSTAVKTGKKRFGHTDADVKSAAIQAAKRHRTSSVSDYLACRNDDRRGGSWDWLAQALRQEVAAGWLTWSSAGVCYICPDGVRAGTEDNAVYQWWHADSQTGGWLPPQAGRASRQTLVRVG